MKISSRQFFMGAALAGFFAMAFVALAGEPPTPALAEKAVAPADAPPAVPNAPEAPRADAAPATPAPEPLPPVELDDKAATAPAIRRIDQPNDGRIQRVERRNRDGGSTDFPIGDHTVPKGGRAREVISIMGSSTVDGEIDSDAVSIRGDTTVGPEGKVGGGAVAVLGHVNVKGEVHDEVVSVLGGVAIDGHVGNDVVAVLGNIELGPNAVIDGDIVLIGGSLAKDPQALVRGNEVHVARFGSLQGVDGLVAWFRNCLLLGRPLAFGPHLGWVWIIALSFLVLYIVFALLFHDGIRKCMHTLETRPGRSILAAVFTMLLAPVAIILLCVTVIGFPLVPFLAVGLFIATLFGKAVMLAWIGGRFTKFFGPGPLAHPAFAVLIGGIIVLALYLVPFVGLLTLKLLGWLGLGVVVYTVLLSSKREKAVVIRPAPPVASVPPIAPVPFVTPVAPVTTSPFVSGASGIVAPATGFASTAAVDTIVQPTETPPPASSAESGAPSMPEPTPTPAPMPTSIPAPAAPPVYPTVVAAVALPRAGFGIRVAAMLLDLVLMAIVLGFSIDLFPRGLHVRGGPGMLPLVAIYAAVMWKTKATTIGGIICGLKVVRLDGREIDWATAIVRALGCFLSLAVVGLGFIWVAIDDDRQSWHDKIAGTTVVRLPKGVSLL